MIVNGHPLDLAKLAAAVTDAVRRSDGAKRRGQSLEFRCPNPAHADVHPSANWDPAKGVWTCHSQHCERTMDCGGGTIALARLLGIDLALYRSSAVGVRRAADDRTPEVPSGAALDLAAFATGRGLDADTLSAMWGVRERQFRGRPALRYPTAIGVDRIKYLDGRNPNKYEWAAKGGCGHWYGLAAASRLLAESGGYLYVVNGEPAVWAAHQFEVPAVCLCVGERSASAAASCAARLAEVVNAIPGCAGVRVVFDADSAGRKGGPEVAAALTAAGLDTKALDLAQAPWPGAMPAMADVGDLARVLKGSLAAALAVLPLIPDTDGNALLRGSDDPSDLEPQAAGDDEAKQGRPPSQATILVGLALDSGVELFRTPAGDAFATVAVDGHRQTLRVGSRAFAHWLRRLYHGAMDGRAVGASAVADAAASLEGQALFGDAEYSVHVRLAGHDGCIYLDLGGASSQVVAVDADGWRIVSDPPVRFWRPRGLRPLPEPAAGGDIGELWRFVHVVPHDRPLILGALVMLFNPSGPYPILNLLGEQGSGKSTAARVLRALIDPNAAPIRAEPREARDLMIAATNGWTVVLDNLSGIQPWLSDALCRLSTGGGFVTRELYTDREEAIFDAQRPVILNGITDLATRSDLLDRSILVRLPRLPDDQRRSEAAFWREFEALNSRLLGCLMDAVSCALRNRDTVKLARLPRMADAAIWAEAAAPALGLAPGEFLEAYERNRTAANEVALDGSPWASVLSELLAASDGVWSGTAGALLNALTSRRGEGRAPRGWPESPRGMSAALRRLAPNLRAIGVDVEFVDGKRRTEAGVRMVIELRLREARGTTGNIGSTGNLEATVVVPGAPVGRHDRQHHAADRQQDMASRAVITLGIAGVAGVAGVDRNPTFVPVGAAIRPDGMSVDLP